MLIATTEIEMDDILENQPESFRIRWKQKSFVVINNKYLKLSALYNIRNLYKYHVLIR